MNEEDISIFLASRFAEFRDLRSALNRNFATGITGERRWRLLDFDSDSSGKPPILEFCLDSASRAEVFILLVGQSYPERGTGPDGKCIFHAEYEAALASPLVRRIFVFLAHACYQPLGLDTQTEQPLQRQLLDCIRGAVQRPGHLVLPIPECAAEAAADCVRAYVEATLKNDQAIMIRSSKNQSVEGRLNGIVMSSRETDALDLPDARDRIAGANERARTVFRSRHVPAQPFERILFRKDDAGSRKILDFETRLLSAVPGEVLGIVSPSGQGKSTFVASFPDRYRLAPSNYLFVTGRELRRSQVERLILDTALLAKTLARSSSADGVAARRFYLFVDALNECDSGDASLLELIVWLEQLIHTAINSLWPITILLTMRPDVAKTVPELSRILVRADNTYDMEPFGEKECRQAFAQHQIRTPYEELTGVMRNVLRDPLMLGIVGIAYAGALLPQDDGDLDLLGTYIKRLAMRSRGASEDQVLGWTRQFAAHLMHAGSQTLSVSQLDPTLTAQALPTLLSAGLLTDEPEQPHARDDTKRLAFRYDRVAEYCIGRHVEAALGIASARPAHPHSDFAETPALFAATAASEHLDSYAELHWSGLCLGLFFFIEADPARRKHLLLPLMKHTNPRWRMLARGVLLKLYATSRGTEPSSFRSIAQYLGEYADRHRADREFRAEYMRMAFEVIAAEYREMVAAQRRTSDLDLLILPLCRGLVSADQEIADQAITCLSSLMARSELLPTLLRLLTREIDRLEMGLFYIVRTQIYIRLSILLRRLLRQTGGTRSAAVPLFSVIKLLVVCFASDMDAGGQDACLRLLSAFLLRLKSGVVGKALSSTAGRHIALFLLSTLVELALRSNKMPINVAEWNALVTDANQYDDFKRSVRLVHFGACDFDPAEIVQRIANKGANPFTYQTLVTALSTKFELASEPLADMDLRAKILATVQQLIDADSGDGVCKYVASLILYHINTFGHHGDSYSAQLMTRLALDLLEHHNGLFGQSRYNSNVIGTTGRSLLNLARRRVDVTDNAFSFIRAQIDKVKQDQHGAFTKYLIENLALLAILVPENLALLRLIKEEIRDTALGSATAPAVKDLDEWVLDAFVRIRATHPIAVDAYLARGKDSGMYHEVRRRHARLTLRGDVQGLDSELVSWAFERVFFDLVAKARNWSGRVEARWSDYLDDSPRLKSVALVQLGLIILGEGFAWADSVPSGLPRAAVSVVNTP